MSPVDSLPYCGAPPDPASLWLRWNLDPGLILVLLALAFAYAAGERRLPRTASGRGQRALFAAGWIVLLAALISPLCSLSVALFSARVGQHMLIALVAAPLIALGYPEARLLALLPEGRRRLDLALGRGLSQEAVAGLFFAVLLWLWHLPGPYAATFRSDAAYWAMHASLFASAVLLWHAMLGRGGRALFGVALGFATSLQMSLLGALLTFSVRPWFAPHLATTAAWGLSPIEDQQLGGLLMWVPGCTLILAAGLLPLARLLRGPQSPAQPDFAASPMASIASSECA